MALGRLGVGTSWGWDVVGWNVVGWDWSSHALPLAHIRLSTSDHWCEEGRGSFPGKTGEKKYHLCTRKNQLLATDRLLNQTRLSQK